MMKKILIGGFSISFIIYWFIIFSYNLPNKYLADRIPSVFGIFNHTWSLFAPMPTENIRLYYDFQYSNELVSIEVLEEINIQKSNAAPFLTKHRIKDFGLTGPIYMIEYRRSNFESPKRSCPENEYEQKLAQNEIEFYEEFRLEPEFNHLYNYGKYYIENNNQLEIPDKFRYRIVYEPISSPDGEIKDSRTVFTSPFKVF